MWISELIDQKQQLQATGPLRHGHLQVFEGGKIAHRVYVQPITFWWRVRNWIARRPRSLRLYDMQKMAGHS